VFYQPHEKAQRGSAEEGGSAGERAEIIATKLDLAAFLQWINNELNGYDGVLAEDLPSYRQIHGEPKAFNPYHGWQPILFRNVETRKFYSRAPIGQAIGPLEEIKRELRGTGCLSPRRKRARPSLLHNRFLRKILARSAMPTIRLV
jgi:hypothetical protein